LQRVSPEVFRWQAEKEGAPVATRNAVLALLDEIRAEADRDRWILRLAVVSVVVTTIATVATIINVALFVAG
jgi:hypothetical protein